MTGHHFAGYSNRFWKLLFRSGLVPEPLTYLDDDRLPRVGVRCDQCRRATDPSIGELQPEEYAAGRLRLRAKVRRHKPAVVAFVGITVYRAMFPDRRGAVTLGPQSERLGSASVFVLPNTSGRNAHYSFDEMLAAFTSLHQNLGPSR